MEFGYLSPISELTPDILQILEILNAFVPKDKYCLIYLFPYLCLANKMQFNGQK